MGRRRDNEKVEQEKADYLGTLKKVQKKLRDSEDGLVYLRPIKFEKLTRPLRNAVRKVNLKFLKGAIARKNNWIASRVLFFPEEIGRHPFDDPAYDEYLFYNTLAVRAEYDKEHCAYRLKALHKIIAEATQQSLYQICLQATDKSENFNLSECEFEELIRQYAIEFAAIGLASVPDKLEVLRPRFDPDVQLVNGKNKKILKFYNFTSVGAYENLLGMDIDDEERQSGRRRVIRPTDHPIESLLLAATFFSLCKRLFALCGLDGIGYNFALQIIVGDGSFPIDENHTISFQGKKHIEEDDMNCLRYSIWTLNGYLRLYCDYRISKLSKYVAGITADERKTYKKMEKGTGKFHNNWAEKEPTAFWRHLGFPLLYTDYHKAGWLGQLERYQDCLPHLDKARVEELSKAWYLPIILPAFAPAKNYPTENCLTITWPLLETEDIKKVEDRFNNSLKNNLLCEHEHIKAVYYQFMHTLVGKEQKELRKELKRSYTAALKTISMRPDTPTKDEEHKACLLGALYFAWNTCKTTEDWGLNRYEPTLRRHIKNVIDILGRVATAKDFALFMKEALDQRPPIVFYWDEDGIYLYYKEYWNSFVNYCEKRGVLLPYSAGMFRREVLAPQGYIRPQYRSQRPKAQIRYDYRKKNHKGEEATVLNVSHDIFQLIPPKT